MSELGGEPQETSDESLHRNSVSRRNEKIRR
jgi:hypothetical protein